MVPWWRCGGAEKTEKADGVAAPRYLHTVVSLVGDAGLSDISNRISSYGLRTMGRSQKCIRVTSIVLADKCIALASPSISRGFFSFGCNRSSTGLDRTHTGYIFLRTKDPICRLHVKSPPCLGLRMLMQEFPSTKADRVTSMPLTPSNSPTIYSQLSTRFSAPTRNREYFFWM
jgi:hypothetical protein